MADQMSVKEAKARLYLASIRLEESVFGRFRRAPLKYALTALAAGFAAAKFGGFAGTAFSIIRKIMRVRR